MDKEQLIAKVRCSCCKGKMSEDFLVLEYYRLAAWETPRANNPLNGQDELAVGFLCQACFSAYQSPGANEAVEFRGEEVVYHPIDDLQKIAIDRRPDHEISKHMKNFAYAMVNFRCDCTGHEHAAECQNSFRVIRAMAEALNWVMGFPSPFFTQLSEGIAAEVEAHKEREKWVNYGKQIGASHVLVITDELAEDDFPVYVMPGDNVEREMDRHTRKTQKQHVSEVIKLA